MNEMFSAVIRAEAGKARMNRTQLAQAVGISPAWTGQLMQGKAEWKMGMIERFAAALGTTPQDLFSKIASDKEVSR